jgi:hypothetical protein
MSEPLRATQIKITHRRAVVFSFFAVGGFVT